MTTPAQMKDLSDAVAQPKTPGRAFVSMVRASSLAGRRTPLRRFVIKDLVPDRTVSMFAGDGGVGKSLVALHMAVCISTSRPWMNIPTDSGPAVFLTAEDELDEIHRRLEAICAFEQFELSDLHNLHILPLSGRDALLAVPDRERGAMQPTKLFEKLRGDLSAIKPKFTVMDTLADIFGGEENQRAQARSFIGLLRGLSLDLDMATVLLSHPSLSGLSSGSGSSGSTGWANSVRSRFYMERPKKVDDEFPDDDVRILTVKKANYGPIGLTLPIRWTNGVFARDDGGPDPERDAAMEAKSTAAEGTFLDILRQHNEQGRRVSSAPSATYAPTVFEKHPSANGFRKKALIPAMERLLRANLIHVEWDGPPSKRRQQLVAGPAPLSESA